jgi:hypothetical protein
MGAPLAMALGQLGSSILGGLTNRSGYKKVSNFDKMQKGIYNRLGQQTNQLGGQGGGYEQALGLLQQYLNPQSDAYKNFEAPYRQEFEQQTVPRLAEQFAGMGAQGGALSSSGFGQALGAAGANLQTNLAQMKSQLQRQSIGDIINQYNRLSGSVLSAQPFSRVDQGPGALSNVFSSLGSIQNPYSFAGSSSNLGGGMSNYQLMNQAAGIRG